MKKEDLEKYRGKDGRIEIDKIFDEHGKKIKTGEEERGDAKKEWLILEDGTRILLREDKFETTKGGPKYTTYQEMIFKALCDQVGMDCADYDLAKVNGKNAVITYNVVDRKENLGLSMYSLSDLMAQTECKYDVGHEYALTDAYAGIRNFCKKMNIDKDQYEAAMLDFTKMQVLDAFLASTDRHPENVSFLFGKNALGEPVFKLSPLYDNELSCGSDLMEDQMQASIEDYREARENARNLMPCTYVPEEELPKEYLKGKNSGQTSNLVRFCMEMDESVEDFASDCMDNLSMIDAIRRVEEQIKAKIPEDYAEFLLANFAEKKKEMSKIIDEFYQII